MPEIRDALIRRHLNSLFSTFKHKHLPINEAELRKFHDEQDYLAMTRLIKEQMLLTLRLKVGFVNKGGPVNAVAWTHGMNRIIPIYGTASFEQLVVTIYIRKNFLKRAPFESVVYTIVHELSHVLLEALQNPLHCVEEAVDLTVLVLGYGRFLATGKTYTVPLHKEPVKDESLFGRIRSYCFVLLKRYEFKENEIPQVNTHTLGYLSPEEIQYAQKIIAAAGR